MILEILMIGWFMNIAAVLILLPLFVINATNNPWLLERIEKHPGRKTRWYTKLTILIPYLSVYKAFKILLYMHTHKIPILIALLDALDKRLYEY